jgi:hypothetical protein
MRSKYTKNIFKNFLTLFNNKNLLSNYRKLKKTDFTFDN